MYSYICTTHTKININIYHSVLYIILFLCLVLCFFFFYFSPKYSDVNYFHLLVSSRQATAATRAAPRPEPSSDNIRSNEISGLTNCRIRFIIRSWNFGWNLYTDPSTPTFLF